MLHPLVLAVLAGGCALVAVVIPLGPVVEPITVASSAVVGGPVDASELTFVVDDRDVTVHAPDGFSVAGWGSSSDGDLSVQLSSIDGGTIGIVFGRGKVPPGDPLGEHDGRPILERPLGGGVAWEVLPGAFVIVRAPEQALDVLVAVLQAIEVR